MKIVLITMAVLALAGCASVSGLRDKAPAFSANSARPVDEVVTCISAAWQAHRAPTRLLPITGGQSLQVDNAALAGSPFAVVDVVSTNAGSQTKYYKQGVVPSAYLDTVKACQ